MLERIAQLPDATAIRVLTTYAKPRERSGTYSTDLTPSLREALQAELGATPAGEPVSEGELARQALLVLVDEPATAKAIGELIDYQAKGRDALAEPVTMALTAAAVLIALQTQVRIERDKEGKWSISINKKPTSPTLIKPLLEKFLGMF